MNSEELAQAIADGMPLGEIVIIGGKNNYGKTALGVPTNAQIEDTQTNG